MDILNAYKPPDSSDSVAKVRSEQETRRRWVIAGGLLFAAVPETLGLYWLVQELGYRSVMPTGAVSCGMGLISALLMIGVSGPCCGTVGAVCGVLTRAIVRGTGSRNQY